MSILYLVSTPIGNLADLSPRARETLGTVSRILAEDTRRTRPLLSHLGVETPLVSFHAHNEVGRRDAVLGWLDAGEDLALVSDAGTPLISDPGERLVEAVAEGGHQVVPIPGPSAILAALVASGLPAGRFSFLGFLPRKGKDRQDLFERLAAESETTVLFESPERLAPTLQQLSDALGPSRRGAVGRELTKLHEEFVRGTLEDLAAHFASKPPRGEVTLVLEGAALGLERPGVDEAAAAALAAALLADGRSPSRAAREVAARLRIPRNQAYRVVQSLSSEERDSGEGDGGQEGESNPGGLDPA